MSRIYTGKVGRPRAKQKVQRSYSAKKERKGFEITQEELDKKKEEFYKKK